VWTGTSSGTTTTSFRKRVNLLEKLIQLYSGIHNSKLNKRQLQPEARLRCGTNSSLGCQCKMQCPNDVPLLQRSRFLFVPITKDTGCFNQLAGTGRLHRK